MVIEAQKLVIVKLLSYNIRFGGRGRERELAEVIRAVAPDLVVFQEATDPDLISRLRRLDGTASLGGATRAFHRLHQPPRDLPSRMALPGRRQTFLSGNSPGGNRRTNLWSSPELDIFKVE